MANTTYDYFYGTQAEQFTFYRLPKVLITDPRFKKVSSDAKILYGVMLERMSLSMKNQWIDDQNRVYIIFTLEDIMETFACGERKAGYLLSELDTKTGIGLVEKKRQGLGKPNLLYLKNFIVKEESSAEDVQVQSGKILQVYGERDYEDSSIIIENAEEYSEDEEACIQSGKILQVKSCKIQPSYAGNNEVIPFGNSDESLECGMKHERRRENVQVQNGKNVQVQSGKNMRIKSSKNVQVQSGKNVQDKNGKILQVKSGRMLPLNNINNNNIDMSKKEFIYPSILNKPEEMDAYRELIKANIEYDFIRADCRMKEEKYLDELVELMVETVCIEEDPIKIGGKQYPYEVVKQRFLKLDASHIRYILHSLHDNTTKVKNIRAYLLTSLMNAALTINHAYQAEVNYDMYRNQG